MSNFAIRVEGLSKQYQIGTASAASYHRLSEAVSGLPSMLFQAGRKLVTKSSASDFEITNSTSSNPAEFWALKDVSFDVEQGEIIGIIGRNGAGKSTLLKILSRIIEPTSGRFGLRGRVASLLEVGTGFHPELTGRENVFLSGITLGMSRAEVKKRFDEIVSFAEVEKFLDTPVKHYSSGMYVRLGFAVAAHLEPEILIVDEVLAVGDASFQKKCLGKMSDSAKCGRTVLFVSHNMTAVRSLCSKAIWINAGTLTEAGPTASVTGRYLVNFSQPVLERTWPSSAVAPGSDAVRLKRIAVHSDEPENQDLTLSRPLRLEIDFWTLTDGLTLNPSVVIQSLDGVPVFNSVPALDFPIVQLSFEKGLFRSVCHIPANLLNDETYRLQLYMIRDHHTCEWRLDDLLTFELRDDTLRKAWYGKWIGMVRPMLQWEITKLE